MSHYDYLHSSSSPGLSGMVEDAFSMVMQSLKQAGFNRKDAFDMLRFGKSGLTPEQQKELVKNHAVTQQFNVLFEAVKPFVNPLTTFTAPKDMKAEEKQAVHDDLYWKKWVPIWDKAFPPGSTTSAAAPQKITPITFRPPMFVLPGIRPGAGAAAAGGSAPLQTGGEGEGEDADKDKDKAKSKISFLPILAVAGIAAILLLRK